MKFTEHDLIEAVKDLATMRFFPHDSKASVMRQLAAMCPHLEGLRYIVDRVLAATGDWPGMQELRGILCSRYDAADGIDAWCTLSGLTANDAENRYLESLIDPSKQKRLQ